MTITLDHTIVAVSDKTRGAALLADLLGVAVQPQAGQFLPVQITDDRTLDFDNRFDAQGRGEHRPAETGERR
jgi:hypothetical protein